MLQVGSISKAFPEGDVVQDCAVPSDDRPVANNDALGMPNHQTGPDSTSHEELGTGRAQVQERDDIGEVPSAPSFKRHLQAQEDGRVGARSPEHIDPLLD
jgi:hypothetical protein